MNINPKVIDISRWDDVEYANGHWIGPTKIYAAGYRGVINKASEGIGWTDPSYAIRRKAMTDAGLLWGAYHFFKLGDPVEQAHYFLSVAKPGGETLLALDHELPQVPLANAKMFLLEIERQTGRLPLFYSYSSMFFEQFEGVNDPWWKKVPVWLAQYSTQPRWPEQLSKPVLWQFTGDGSGPEPHHVPGVSIAGGCDINSFDGSDEDLRKFWIGKD